jgi:hypothetical protein
VKPNVLCGFMGIDSAFDCVFLQQNVDLRIPWQMKHFAYISCCRLACFIMKHFWPGVPVVVMMDLILKSQYRVRIRLRVSELDLQPIFYFSSSISLDR